MTQLECEVRGQIVAVPLYCQEKRRVRRRGEWIEFELAADAHTYLTSARAGVRRPDDDGRLRLAAGREHWLSIACEVNGGTAGLWVLDFDGAGRSTPHKVRLRTGDAAINVRIGPDHRALTIAVRLSGTGRLRLGRLEVRDAPPAAPAVEPAARRTVQVGPDGQFRRPALFFDPSGYRRYKKFHLDYYDGRQPSWYAGAANRVAGHRRVLEIACGPGLLLEQLRADDPDRPVYGLERDPVFLGRCVEKGLPVVFHDLNHPFPFVASRSFDAVISHHGLDSLTPLALRTCLRECARVLVPGGKFWAKSQRRGQATGNLTRTIALTRELMTAALEEAGFVDFKVRTPDVSIDITAVGPAEGPTGWPARALEPFAGVEIKPWSAARAPLAPAVGQAVWDDRSRRDFTLLTDAAKRTVRVHGRRVGYFTGYAGEGPERAIGRAIEEAGGAWRRDPGEPVLRGGLGWDDGGVAAGSVLALEDGGYRMYFSGRDTARTWRGVGIAESDDGLVWRKRADRVLRVEDDAELKQLVLADVVRGSDGVWRMHCEAWRGKGWVIVQATSADGIAWSKGEVVLEPAAVDWAPWHVANPKAVEVRPGEWLLGFNGTGPGLRFQLGLARSTDGRSWQPLELGPLLCTEGDRRLESLFTAAEAWADGSQEAFFFAAATSDTTASSDVRAAVADPDAAWAGPPWTTRRPGLYRVAAGHLVAAPGVTSPEERLAREVRLDGRDAQIALRYQLSERGGDVAIRAGGTIVSLGADGEISAGGERVAAAAAAGGATTVCAMVRVHRAGQGDAEIEVLAWHGDRIAGRRQLPIDGPVERVAIDLGAPAGASPLVVEMVDVWTPELREIEAPGDALWEVPAGADPIKALSRRKPPPGRVLASSRTVDVSAVAPDRAPGVFFPLVRIPRIADGFDDRGDHRADQLDLLWQTGRLIGIDLRGVREVPAAVSAWLADRNVIAVVDAAALAIPRCGGPVIGTGQLDAAAWSAWLAAGTERLALLAAGEVGPDMLALAARLPEQWMLASHADPKSWESAVEKLREHVPAAVLPLVLSENLRHAIESVQRARWDALLEPDSLRFPPVPINPWECTTQGFEILPLDAVPASDESGIAGGVRSGQGDKEPWTGVIAQRVRDLGARRVLELTDARDLTPLPDGAFELVHCVSVLDHMSDIAEVCRQLVRVASKHLFLMEVRLPVEGRVVKYVENGTGAVRSSTGADYSWHIEKYLEHPRVRRLEVVPCYLHAGALGPYYATYLAELAP